MAADLILVTAGLTTAWAVFGIIGGERQRVVQDIEALRRARKAAAADKSAQKPPAGASQK